MKSCTCDNAIKSNEKIDRELSVRSRKAQISLLSESTSFKTICRTSFLPTTWRIQVIVGSHRLLVMRKNLVAFVKKSKLIRKPFINLLAWTALMMLLRVNFTMMN